jgi:hypothetical protein
MVAVADSAARMLSQPVDALGASGVYRASMLLATFHGGSGGETNVLAFDTSSGQIQTSALLSLPPNGELDELRAIVSANGYLYVANGGTTTSSVLCYQLASTSPPSAAWVATLLTATLSKGKDFDTAIAHPFGLALDGEDVLYVSNQDTNVVARAALTNCGTAAALGTGCQSASLAGQFPKPATFLAGTYVASQNGSLHHVDVTAPNVPASEGGLGVTIDPSSQKVQNSVRDVALANGLLLVCDEPGKRITMYATADGSYVGASNSLDNGPTHLLMVNGGVLVSAKTELYWGQLPAAGATPALTLKPVALTLPGKATIGGLTCTGTAPMTAYVVIQSGTGGAFGGAIYSYTVTQSNAGSMPVFSNQQVFVQSGPKTFSDTPEFVLIV